MAKAQSLLFEHNLTLSQIESTEAAPEKESIENIAVELDANRNTVVWKRTLIGIMARNNFCMAVTIPNTTRMQIIGTRSNVQIVEYMTSYMAREIERLAKQAARSQLSGKASFVSSFCRGALATINQRLYEQRQANTQASAASTALVVQSKGALDKAVKGFYPRLTSSSPNRRSTNRDGYRAGQAAGHGIGLASTGIGHGSQRRIG